MMQKSFNYHDILAKVQLKQSFFSLAQKYTQKTFIYLLEY